MKIRTKLIAAFLALGITPVAVLGFFAWRSASPIAASVSRNCLRMTALLLGLILIITSALEGGLLSKRADIWNSTPKIG